ncbi:piggyBac transposable element-derived protein 4-like [Pecten maximus]|uniref:piggyBac transposable element-derived protein 4-like n=1 Tax=Pecten maximus TaxID=6579 RepID=UPI0014586C8D|nr:piggyBac transposable element-derived protein 4-like [Pecten maximus]
MSSETESSDGENFDGFDPEEAQDAENNFLAMLRHQGIGDDAVSDVSEVETDVDDAEVELGPGGAADDQDEWHAGFDYFERGLPHIFTPRRNTGPTRSMPPDKEPIDFLALFLDQVLIDLLLEETGRYAQQQIDTNPEQNKQPWKDVSAAEMKAFLGLCMAMGVTRKPSVKLYWSTDSYSETPLFARTMTRDRFSQILRYLHFADNDLEQERNSPTYDPLFKIRTLVSHLNENFVQEYVLRRRVTVDECMVPFKGKVHFKQYMRLKPQKWRRIH